MKDRPRVRVKDLPACGRPVAVWWRNRRLVCAEPTCPRGSFTEVSVEIPPRSRLTGRLRTRLATAIAGPNRAVSDVAAEHGVAWHTAHSALVAEAVRWLPASTPTRVLGVDETRARSVRWILQEAGWRRSDPWLRRFVDADPDTHGRLLGLAPAAPAAASANGWPSRPGRSGPPSRS